MKAILITLMITLLTCGMAFSQSISLESVDNTAGDPGNPYFPTDGSTTVTFNIRLTNDATANGGITNGFRIYSEDGATWGSTVPDTFSFGWPDMFDLIYVVFEFNVDRDMEDG